MSLIEAVEEFVKSGAEYANLDCIEGRMSIGYDHYFYTKNTGTKLDKLITIFSVRIKDEYQRKGIFTTILNNLDNYNILISDCSTHSMQDFIKNFFSLQGVSFYQDGEPTEDAEYSNDYILPNLL
jgi:hypothetical protein